MNFKKILLSIFALITTLLPLSGCGDTLQPDNTQTEPVLSGNTLSVFLLKVGKADAIICETGGHTLVIDAGEDDDGDEITDFLEDHGINKIDTLIITHYDKDHVGGADTIVSEIPIDRVLIPDYEGTRPEYDDFITALDEAQIVPELITSKHMLQLGDATVTVIPPASYEIPEGYDEYDNNFSLLTTIDFGEKRLFFTGDIEEERIEELVQNNELESCDFLKVPHHGKYTEALDDLFRITSPAYAAICTSKKNPADDRTLKLLKKYGADTAETRSGDITVITDGKKIDMYQE